MSKNKKFVLILIFGLLVMILLSCVCSASWKTIGKDYTRNGYIPGLELNLTDIENKQLWNSSRNASFPYYISSESAVIDDSKERLYIVGSGPSPDWTSYLIGYDLLTGDIKLLPGDVTLTTELAAGEYVQEGLSIDTYGHIYVSGYNRFYRVYSYGGIKWSVGSGDYGAYGYGSSNSPATVFGNYVFVDTWNALIDAFNYNSGVYEWSSSPGQLYLEGFETDGSSMSSIQSNGKVVAMGNHVNDSSNYSLISFDPYVNGNIVWIKNVSNGYYINLYQYGSDDFASPVVSGDYIYFANAVFDNNGNEVWNTTLSGDVFSTPVVTSDAVYYLTTDGNLTKVQKSNGSKIWSVNTGQSWYTSNAPSRPIATDDYVLFCGDDSYGGSNPNGALLIYDTDGNEIVHMVGSGDDTTIPTCANSAISLSDSGLLVMSNENVVSVWDIGIEEILIPLESLTPLNGTTVETPVTFTWREYPTHTPYTLYIATDNQYINIVSQTLISSGVDENFTTTISGLTPGTKYWWKVKSYSGLYTDSMNFTVSQARGSFNVTVFDECNMSKMIYDYTMHLYNTTSIVVKTSNTTTGWTNFNETEILAGEYLLIVVPKDEFDNYYQRMVLANSPDNVTMYVPNSTTPNNINLITFSLQDTTGFFPYQTSTITISRGGIVMDKSYFSVDGTHQVYLLQGVNYQVTIQYGDNVFYGNNFMPLTSGSHTITINDFSVDTTSLDPFLYNITHTQDTITLNWNDVGGVLSSLNFTVRNLTSNIQICDLITSVGYGQSVCSINNQSAFYVIFSAKLIDGTYQNTSFVVDYTYGVRKSSTGISPIDGSPIGIGFKWDYGTWVTPDWIYNWVSLILILLLAGSFGGYHSGLGGIITIIIALLLELWGFFNPLGDADPKNIITMGITGGILLLAIGYYLQHKDRGGQ